MKLLKHIRPIYFAMLLLSLTGACKKDDSLPAEPIENLGGYRTAGVPEIDSWIQRQLTKPFNVYVKYQYDPFEIDYTKNTVPPHEEYIIPVMQLVIKSMVEPYITVSDSSLVRRIMPKLWVLVGSAQYNDDGTVVLGQAEGGNKITVMDVNKYSKSNNSFIENTAYTVHHETAHIMHQTRMYSPNFGYVNPENYTTTWFNVSDEDAYKLGFVRNYAMASRDEDFVETVACLLAKGQQAFDQIVNKSTEQGKSRLRLKEQYVVDYFKDKWEIDFRQLQLEVKQGLTAYKQQN